MRECEFVPSRGASKVGETEAMPQSGKKKKHCPFQRGEVSHYGLRKRSKSHHLCTRQRQPALEGDT